MINVKEAQEKILENVFSVGVENIALNCAGNRVLPEDVIAPVSSPLFDQTAVDGYALQFEDVADGKALSVIGEIRAGNCPEIALSSGNVFRIFTGAPIPENSDTVVMQEFVEANGNSIYIKDKGLKKGANIRREGEQIKKGDTALKKGTLLNAAGIGFLASLGFESVEVSCLPKVGIITTGNEFVEKTKQLQKGKKFESNGVMLQCALRAMGIDIGFKKSVDNLAALKELLKNEAEIKDVIIITGGVSVGKYDFTKEALEEIGFEIVFHKVSQKPGKPILFARRGNKIAFGLPGNPRAALVCFYEYAAPFIKAVMGCSKPFLPELKMQLTHDYNKKRGRSQFLAAKFADGGVEVLEGQGSHMLKSLSEADAIIELQAENEHVKKGELVDVHLLPGNN